MRHRFALALLAGGVLCACGKEAVPLSAVLITLDTTNRDALGCYGQPLAVTPNLDRLARDGLVFDQARAVAPLTLPAHISMMTGLFPLRHGVRDNALVPLSESAETLAERLSTAGYQTAAFVSAVVLAAPYELDQGFATYDAPSVRQEKGIQIVERPAAETVNAANAWLRARDPARPFFLWVHGYDPHGPYVPAPQFLAQAQGNAYLGEVAALDHAVGELLATLESEGVLERVVIVTVADHGEGLGDHGEATHAVLCYERMLRVPLIVRLPGAARAGERSSTPVSAADVAPTFLEALGLEVPRDLDGASLLALGNAPRGTYFESYHGYLNYGWSPLCGWVDGQAKVLQGTDPELYDLALDPLETNNLYATQDERVARARDALMALASKPRLELSAGVVDEDLVAGVQALGYAGSSGAESTYPEPLEATGLPPARVHIGEIEVFARAVRQYDKGKKQEGIAELEALVARNPRNSEALNVLASFLFEQKEYARALAALEKTPSGAIERTSVQDLMGHCLEHLDRPQAALEHFERALRFKPGDPHQLKDIERLRAKLAR